MLTETIMLTEGPLPRSTARKPSASGDFARRVGPPTCWASPRATRTIEYTQREAGVQEAAMRLRSHRRNLVVWGLSVAPAGKRDDPGLAPLPRNRPIRRSFRICGLLTIIGLMHLARGVRRRWRPLLAGGVLTAAGVMLRDGVWGVVALPGLWFLVYALLVPTSPDADRRRRTELERELAAYSTAAQRRDLEATLDRYPDDVTHELRDILFTTQAMTACGNGIPGAGRR